MIGAKAAITWSAPRCNHMTTPMAEIIWNAPGWNHMTTSLAAITWSAQRCNHMTTPLAEITWSALGWNHMRARRGSYDWSLPVQKLSRFGSTRLCLIKNILNSACRDTDMSNESFWRFERRHFLLNQMLRHEKQNTFKKILLYKNPKGSKEPNIV